MWGPEGSAEGATLPCVVLLYGGGWGGTLATRVYDALSGLALGSSATQGVASLALGYPMLPRWGKDP